MLFASALAPVSAQSPSHDDTAPEPTGDVQVGYLLTADLFTRPSVLAHSVGPVSRNDRVRVVRYAERRGWFEVYSLESARLLGYAYQPYVSRFGADGPEVPPRADADIIPAAVGGDEQRPVSLPAPPPPGRQLPEVVFSAAPAAGVRCSVGLWSNVRRGPGLGYEAFGVIRPGIPFHVQTMKDGWGKVQLVEQGAGYVSHVLLDCMPDTIAPAAVAPVPIGAVAFPHSGELASSVPSRAPPPADPPTAVEPTTGATSQASALRALLVAAGVDPESVVYVSSADTRFHRPACPHLDAEAHPLPLTEAMMDHTPCAHCVPLILPARGVPSTH